MLCGFCQVSLQKSFSVIPLSIVEPSNSPSLLTLCPEDFLQTLCVQIHPRSLRNWWCAVKRMRATVKLVVNRCIAQLIFQASVSSIINHRLFTKSYYRKAHHWQSQEGTWYQELGKDGGERWTEAEETGHNVSKQVSFGPRKFISCQSPELLPV